MLNILLLQQNYKIGALRENALKIESIVKSLPLGVDLVITSELSLTGYPPRDLLLWSSFYNEISEQLNFLANSLKNHAPVLLGVPIKKDSKVFNGVCLLENGTIKEIAFKNQLPQCNIFDEKHYFDSSSKYSFFRLKNYNICVTICRDLWDESIEFSTYKTNTLEAYINNNNCEILVNLSASPFWIGKHEERYQIARRLVQNCRVPLVYVNQIGANDSTVFDGSSFIMDASGTIICEMPSFIESFTTYKLEVKRENLKNLKVASQREPFEKNFLLYEAIILGIKDYFKKSNIDNAIIGLSGGIDSSLTALLVTKALGNSHVFGILMPSCYTSERSNVDAEKIAKNLNIRTIRLSIEQYQRYFEEDLNIHTQFFVDNGYSCNKDIVWENLQARIRGLYIMSIANCIGALSLVTSNRSEIAVGYCTMYGDTCGALAPLGDLYKTEVYDLVNWINLQNRDIIGGYIPYSIVERPPTAELRPDQHDQQTLPPYKVLDGILHLCTEKKLGIQEIVEKGYSCSVVLDVLRLLKKSEFKRKQLAPIVKLRKYSFDQGWRLPIIADWPMFESKK